MVKIKKEETKKSATNLYKSIQILYKFFTKYTQEKETQSNTLKTKDDDKQNNISLWDHIESLVPKIVGQSTFRNHSHTGGRMDRRNYPNK